MPYFRSLFPQREFAAFLAICLRLDADRFSALALPPFIPPSRPRATAAGFFPAFSGLVASAVIAAANAFTSIGLFLLERVGMPQW
jgi:hypothetical protein